MCEPPRASVVERGAVLWWVAGFLTYLCPLNIRPLPRGWSEHRRASVRSARGVPRVCIEAMETRAKSARTGERRASLRVPHGELSSETNTRAGESM